MGPDPERCLNLLHCLNELNDGSLLEEVQSFMKAGCVGSTALTPSQWASLVFVLLTSDEELTEFDLGKFSRSEEGLRRMMPVIKVAQIVNLSACGLTGSSCDLLSTLLLSSSQIQQLDLSFNRITNGGLHRLCSAMRDSPLHTLRLRGCGLTELGVESLSSAQCKLRSLDVSDNDIGDGGVQMLSEGLSSPHCDLEVLSLSLCRVTEKGCLFLASALNHSVLKELDLSYNHPGPSGLQLLRALRDDPHCSLHTVRVEECGESRIQPGPKKYAVELSLDAASSHKDLSLCDRRRRATRGLTRSGPAPAGPSHRFSFWTQVVCTRGLTGRSYWESEYEGRAAVGVAYGHMPRTGEGTESWLGHNKWSWALSCGCDGFTALHNGEKNAVQVRSNRIGVFLDWDFGELSFFDVREGELQRIFTFKANFTFPLFPAFRLGWIGSSIHLC